MRTLLSGALCALLFLCVGLNCVQAQENSAAQAEAEKLAQLAREASGADQVTPPTPPASPTPVPVATATPPPKKGPLNLNQADLNTVLKYISSKTGKPVVFGAGITPEIIEKKKITIINPVEQTDDQNLALLYRVLSHQDITVVDEDDILVVQVLEGKRRPNIPFQTTFPATPELEIPITQAIELEYISGAKILDFLKSMVRNPDALQYDSSTNTLFYTDTRSYVEKLLFLTDLFDKKRKDGLLPRVTQVTHVSAEELIEPSLNFLDNYAKALGLTGSKTMVKTEPVSNSLIIRGPTNEVEALNRVIQQLDQPSWRAIQRVTQNRPLNRMSPDELIDRANKYLASYVAIHGDPGDIPLTIFKYDSAKRELVLKGPQAEIDALLPMFDRWDPLVSEQTRGFRDPTQRESLIEAAIQVLIDQYGKEGWTDYEHHITWEVDRFDPSKVVFRGPEEELTRLFSILNLIDKPEERRSRQFNNLSPIEVIPQALDFMVQETRREGNPGFEHSVTWERNNLVPGQIEIVGPVEQLDRLFPIIERLDPIVTTRTRSIQHAVPEEVIPTALDILVEQYEDQGKVGYRTATTWERDRFDPKTIVFKGPPQEITDLFPILDQLDKPLVHQTRSFYSGSPDEIIPKAKEILIQQYAEDGYVDYEPTILWKRDLLDPTKFRISAPTQELARLTEILNKIDPPTTLRTRSVIHATPEVVIPAALDIVRQQQVEEGLTDYTTHTTWERDRWDPSIVRFEGPPAELALLFTVLDKLDKPRLTQTRPFYTHPPEQAIPEAIELLSRQYAEEGKPGYPFSIEWDRDPIEPSNIRIKGPADEVSRLVAVLDQIDKPVQIVRQPILNRDPKGLISPALSLLKQYYVDNNRPEYEPSAEIRFDEITGSLTLRAPAEELSVLQSIFTDLDRAQWQHQTITTQVVPLGVASAEDLIQTASEHLSQRVELQGEYGDKAGVVFKVDTVTDSVLLYGPTTQIAICVEVMTALEANSKRGLKPVVIYPNHTSPSQLSTELNSFASTTFAPNMAPTIQVNDRLGALFVTGTDEAVDRVRDWVRLFDVPRGQNQTQRIVKLKNAEAGTLQSVLNQLDILSPDGRMVAETQSNSLLIVDTTQTIDRLMPFIEDLDVVPPFDNMVYQVIKTRTAQAGYLQTALNQYAQQLASQKGRATRNRATVSYEPNSGSVIVFGLKSDVEQIAKVAAEFDKIQLEDKKPEFIYLEHADANQASSILSSLLSNISPSQSPSLVIPESRINALIVVAEEEVLAQVKEIVAKIDVESEETQEFRVIPLENVTSSQMYSVVYQALINDYTGSQAPYVTYEYYSNSLIVRAHPDDFAKVETLISQLDVVSDKQQEVRLIKLDHASAPQIYTVVSSLLSSISGGVTTPYVTYLDNSTLVVRAQKDQFSKIEEVIKEFDIPKTSDQEFRVFEPKYIGSNVAYNALYYLLMSDHTGTTQPYVTNSGGQVFVRAHKNDFPKVEKLLAEIDVSDTEDHEFRVIQVQHVSADQADKAVYHLLMNKYTGTTAPYVTYTGTQLLIRAHKNDFEKVDEILAEVDIPQTRDYEFRVFPVKHAVPSQVYYAVLYSLQSEYKGAVAPYVNYAN